MPREILIARRDQAEPARFLLDVFHDGERWTGTLARLNTAGDAETTSVTPRFYGLTAEQARRRVITALENEWDEVLPAGAAEDPPPR